MTRMSQHLGITVTNVTQRLKGPKIIEALQPLKHYEPIRISFQSASNQLALSLPFYLFC